jgi:hypothetical protein
MSVSTDLDAVYVPSAEVVARVIGDELVIVPLAGGLGDLEGELYSLNETGRAVWSRLDGRSLRDIAADLAGEFDAPSDLLERDVAGLLEELLARRIVVRKPD